MDVVWALNCRRGKMRELKFRIFLGGIWHYWGFIEEPHGIVFRALPSSNVDPMSLQEAQERSQQFTGLHDKNGKEIYSGDILQFDNAFDGIQQVKWDNETCGFAPFSIYDVDCNDYYKASECKVIGNCHEHPELLDA